MTSAQTAEPNGWIGRWWLAMVGAALIACGVLVAQGSWALLPNNGEVTPGSSPSAFVSEFIQPDIIVLVYVGQALMIIGAAAVLAGLALRAAGHRRTARGATIAAR